MNGPAIILSRLVAVALIALLAVSPLSRAHAQDAATPEASAEVSSETGQHPLWKVSKDGNTIYLMGSVHLLKPDAYPLDPVMYDAFEASDRVVFELDFDSLQAKMPMMMQRGVYQDGQTLKEALSDETYAMLQAQMDSLGVNMAMLQQMKPWMVAMSLPTLVLQKEGYSAESGIEMHFYQKAQAAGKDVSGLETFEEQIGLLEFISSGDPDAFMKMTLEQMDDVSAMMERITTHWKAGDVDELAALLNEGFEGYPDMQDAMLADRNRNWIPQIEALISENSNAIVIVGAGHLAGEDSVVDLLRDKGYTVEQL